MLRRVLSVLVPVAVWAALAPARSIAPGEEAPLAPGQTLTIPLDTLRPCLLEMKRQDKVEAVMTAVLPEDYAPERKFPALIFLGGSEGGRGDTPGMALELSGKKGFVSLSLPLYKKQLNSQGIDIYIGAGDFKTIAEAYSEAFDLLRKRVPNMADNGWVFAGFSNGAHSAGAVIGDKKLFKLFKYFILVEGGAEVGSFPSAAKGLLMIGEKSNYGKGMTFDKGGEVKNYPPLFSGFKRRNVTFIPMMGVGHEFPEEYKAKAKAWLHERLAEDAASTGARK